MVVCSNGLDTVEELDEDGIDDLRTLVVWAVSYAFQSYDLYTSAYVSIRQHPSAYELRTLVVRTASYAF